MFLQTFTSRENAGTVNKFIVRVKIIIYPDQTTNLYTQTDKIAKHKIDRSIIKIYTDNFSFLDSFLPVFGVAVSMLSTAFKV